MYENSAELARATPHIRLSRPTPPDNTEWFNHDEQRLIEPAKVALCFDCQQPIEAGKGIQVVRNQRTLCYEGVPLVFDGPVRSPMNALVHPGCNLPCSNDAR